MRLPTIAAALAAALATAPLAAQPAQVNLGGSSTTSPFFAYYSAVAETISKRTGINTTLISAGGYDVNMQQLRQGAMQLAGMSPDLINDAENDARRPFKEVRALWWATSAPQYIVVRADSGIAAMKDLNGRCFHPGMSGSSSEKNMMRILRALQITPKLHLSDPRDAIAAIQNRRCEGQVRSGSTGRLDAATEELNLGTPLRLIGYTPDEVAKIRAQYAWMPLVEQRADVLKGTPAFVTHEIPVGVVATTKMDADTAYRVTKAMWEGIADQRAAFKQIQGVDVPRKTMETQSALLHAGAIRYYRELGLTVPEAVIPPEAK
ncbi:MAG: TAXI family TRAP transporter solute-binding subunit [Alphaproteobacteria bacterium]|nr:TAXI family TRAP transporter solute-binding subunit [Alphaproteobacteria bacterium]